MRGIIMMGLALFLVFNSCNNDKEDKKEVTSENDVDAARNFIRSALDGNWREARRFMLQDSTNTQLLDTYENNYQVHMNKEDKRGYREASITLYDTREVNDSVAIINYSNSFKKQKDSLRVVRIDGTWMVDLKYSFPQTDTSAHAH
jgi:DTW domain-containing protein YfiP